MIGRIKRLISSHLAKKSTFLFQHKYKDLIEQIPKHLPIDFEVVSFSGSKQFNDQLYSILSFFYNVGIPLKWTVYSDGTYTENEKEIMTSVKNVVFKEVDTTGFDDNWNLMFDANPTLKKIAILSKLNIIRTTIFVDSDVLFFSSFLHYIEGLKDHNWYLEDESPNYFDTDLIQNIELIKHPLNFGMLILNATHNWQFVLEYLTNKLTNGTLSYWSDQTALHLFANQPGSNFYPLPKEYFVVNGSDSFKLGHDFNYNSIAVRHFVSPIRHKMWQYSWKKVLGVS